MTTTNVREALAELVGKALNRAWSLGQTYWQQADSASYRENARAHATRGIYEALREETLAALASHPSPAPQPDERDAEAELNCAEEVLDSLAVNLDLEQTHFDCVGDYITAVVEATRRAQAEPKVQAQAAEPILGATVTLDALEKALRQRLSIQEELERLTRWARTMVGNCDCTGDHPIAHAERTLGWRK